MSTYERSVCCGTAHMFVGRACVGALSELGGGGSCVEIVERLPNISKPRMWTLIYIFAAPEIGSSLRLYCSLYIRSSTITYEQRAHVVARHSTLLLHWHKTAPTTHPHTHTPTYPHTEHTSPGLVAWGGCTAPTSGRAGPDRTVDDVDAEKKGD